MTTSTIHTAEDILQSAHWNNQYENYDARSIEAKMELWQSGYIIGGEGEDIGIMALIGFFEDDSRYSRSLESAKNYSGLSPDLKPIVFSPARAAEKAKEGQKIIKNANEEKAKERAALASIKVGDTVIASARYGNVSIIVDEIGDGVVYGCVAGNDRRWVVRPFIFSDKTELTASYSY